MKHFLKTAFRLTFRGKWVTRSITVLLTAVSLAFFSLAFTGYSYDREEYFHRAYQDMLHERKYLTFSNEINIDVDSLTGLHASGDMWGRPYFSPSEVRQIEEEIPLGFLSVCRTDTEVQAYVDKLYFRGVKEIDGKPTARIMFFNGLSRDEHGNPLAGLENPYVEDNLAFSLQLQLLREVQLAEGLPPADLRPEQII